VVEFDGDLHHTVGYADLHRRLQMTVTGLDGCLATALDVLASWLIIAGGEAVPQFS